jgi:uncharacterized iron-regulated protein
MKKKGPVQPWLETRKELYRQLQSYVENLLGSESAGLRTYRRDYDQMFNSRWKAIDRKNLIQRTQKARLIFFADFHALQQSQKTHLRILKALPEKQKRIIGVECIEARHQKHIDSYLCGEFSEQEFLGHVEWDQSWGFPWENYRPLFHWARLRKIRIVGLNLLSQQKSAASLKKRDLFAAQKINEILKKYADHQVFVIFGDLHVSEKHLPRAVLKLCPKLTVNQTTNSWMSIFQNSEKIYFDLLAKNKESEVEIVQLKKNQFCLLNIPPWVKWQSYLLYLESHFDTALDHEDEEFEAIDYTDHLEKYGKILAADLGVTMPSGSFSVYSATDDSIFEKLTSFFNEAEMRWFSYLIEASRSFYCPELKLAFLGRPSVNYAAALAMAAIHCNLADIQRTPLRMPADFTRLIFSEAIQYLGSKMINPKRKTDTVADIRAAFASRASGTGLREGRESLALALSQKMQEILSTGSSQRLQTGLVKQKSQFEAPSIRKRASYYEAARLLGGMMGEKLYNGFRHGLLSKNSLVKLLKSPMDTPSFNEFYMGLVELVETLPEPFQSKSEKI